MAFEGDLSQLGLGDVLQTIAMSRQVGTFVLRGVETRHLACKPQGVALLATKKSLGLKIGTVLVGSGKVTEAQIEEALKLQSRKRELLLGQALTEIGACTAEDVRGARRYLAAEEIFELFLWKEGQFEFQSGEPDCSGPFADLWFDVPSLAMEAARRLDEIPRIAAVVPEDEVFVTCASPSTPLGDVLSNRDLGNLFALLSPGRRVADVQEAFYRGRFDTLKGLQTLIEAGIVRPATPAEIAEAAKAASASGEHLRAAGLWRRVIGHTPADDAAKRSLVEALLESGDKRHAAEELVRMGADRLSAGKALPAIESFETALKIDPTHHVAHEGLLHALAEAGRVDEAADRALAAARLCNSDGDYESACRVAEAGLTHRPGDPMLLLCLANGHQGLGDSAQALKILDETVAHIEKAGKADGDLVEVLRRIVQIDPERKDAARRIEETLTNSATRRRRVMRRLAIAAGVLVLAAAAVPVFSGPSALERIQQAQQLLDENSPQEAAAVLASIDESDLDEDTLFDKQLLDARAEKILHPPPGSAARIEFGDRVDLAYKRAADAISEEHIDEGLTAIVTVLDLIEGTEGRKIAAGDQQGFKKLRAATLRDVQTALANAATASQAVASRIAAVRGKFSEDLWKREDLEALHDIIAQSEKVIAQTLPANWETVPRIVEQIVKRVGPPAEGTDRATVEAAAAIADAHSRVVEDHDRALARARRKELKEGYKAAYATGAQLQRDGKLEEALAQYEKFLALCAELRTAEPESLYAPMVRELFGGEMQLDQRIRTTRDRIATIVRECDEAQKAEFADDVETAFRLRRHLVRDHADIDLTRRFQLPLRIETAPSGAQVFLLDETPGGRSLGWTPLVTSYPVANGARWQLRLPGYRSFDVIRKGAADDSSGVEHVDLPKLATWSSKPGGMSEAAPAVVPGALLVAGRNGVIRRIDAASGEESARFEPRLLDGFAASVVVRGDRAFAAALDGKGYVLDATRLTSLATFETGPVRGSPIGVDGGVVVADETGTVRLVNDAGTSVWTKSVGRVKTDLVVAGGHVLLVTAESEVVAIDAAKGEILRRRQLGAEHTWGPPTVRGTRVFLGSDAGTLLCLDAATLETAWSQQLDGPVRGHVGATELRLVACTANGAVHVLDAETGAILSKTLVGGRIDAGPCDLPDGGFVVVTAKGNATRFDPRAKVVWVYDAGEDVSAPAQFVHAAVVIVTRKGTVIALAP